MRKKKNRGLSRRIGLPVGLVLAASSTANAQDAQVQDVVVTAPQTPETVSRDQLDEFQSKPKAVTVVTEDQIRALNITNLQEAQKLVPSLQIRFSNVRNLSINVRGFGASSSNATDGIFSGTPIYIDGIYQPRPGQAVFDIPDLVGVEVLKGPQATAGGQDNTGGVVNLTTALPSFTTQSYGELSYGNYNFGQVKAGVTGAVADSDSFAFRLSAFTTDRNGYIANQFGAQEFNDWHDKGARLQFLYQPDSNLTARFIFDYSHVNQACCINLFGGVVTSFQNGAPVTNNFYQRIARLGYTQVNFGAPQNYIASINGYLQTAQESFGAAAKIDYTFNGFTLNSITSLRGWDFHPNNRENGLIGPQLITNSNGHVSPTRSVVQELKLSTPRGEKIEAMAGIFYLYEQLYDYGLTTWGGDAGPFYGTNASTLVNNVALNNLGRQTYDNPRTNEIAAYTQGVWHATPELDIAGGLRYSFTQKNSIFRQYIFSDQPLFVLTPAQQAAAQRQISNLGGPDFLQNTENTNQGIFSFLANASYKFTPDVLGYVTVSQGGRAGGPNPAANLPVGTPVTVKPEILQNYEVGLKGAFFEGRLLTNIAAFVMYNQNYITNATTLVGGTNVTYLANAQSAISRGVEVDIRYSPFDGLNTYAAMTYDDAFYGSYTNAACPFEQSNLGGSCNLTGKPLSVTPKFAAVIGGEFSWPLDSSADLFQKPMVGYLGGNWTYQSQVYSDPTDSIYSIIPAYGLLNLYGGLRLADWSLDLQGWVHNALDKRYFINLSPTALPGGAIGGNVGDPLMGGVTLRVRI